jgi:hypothetical protein
MDQLNQVTKTLQSYSEPVLRNPYVMAILKVSLILYAARIAPNPPVYLQRLFENTFFKIFAIFLIMIFVDVDFQLAILFATIYVITMNYLSGRKLLESFAPFDKDAKFDERATLISPTGHIFPSCVNVKVDDLLKLFEGDSAQLQRAAHLSFQHLVSNMKDTPAKERLERIARVTGLPSNLEINDANAPYVATLLVNYNVEVNESCRPPQQ